jgi:hypothetical protein
VVRRRVERLLRWLAAFDGDTWEQRWLASGADAAPLGWAEAAFPDHDQPWQSNAVTGGVYLLIQARVLRPSYAWLRGLACGFAGEARRSPGASPTRRDRAATLASFEQTF